MKSLVARLASVAMADGGQGGPDAEQGSKEEAKKDGHGSEDDCDDAEDDCSQVSQVSVDENGIPTCLQPPPRSRQLANDEVISPIGLKNVAKAFAFAAQAEPLPCGKRETKAIAAENAKTQKAYVSRSRSRRESQKKPEAGNPQEASGLV